jgi:hypothetical protein
MFKKHKFLNKNSIVPKKTVKFPEIQKPNVSIRPIDTFFKNPVVQTIQPVQANPQPQPVQTQKTQVIQPVQTQKTQVIQPVQFQTSSSLSNLGKNEKKNK